MKIPPHLTRSLRRFAAQRPEARRFAAVAWLAAPTIELSLRWLGLQRTLAWIEASPPRTPRPRRVSLEEGERLVEGVYRAHVVDGKCLPRSLLRYWLHRREGSPARFVMGVRRGPDQLMAHAWVEGAPDPVARQEFAELFTRGLA